jgi:hypothetical protein
MSANMNEEQIKNVLGINNWRELSNEDFIVFVEKLSSARVTISI